MWSNKENKGFGMFVGIDVSLHVGLGGHFTIGWDLDEFFQAMFE